jgi:ankyrin repeat protein
MFAAQYGRLNVCQFQAEQGANVNFKNNTGCTALMWAAMSGRLNIVNF